MIALNASAPIGGYTGEGAKTVIPGQASAKVSFRLVGQQDPAKIRDAFRAFVQARLPADCKVEFGNFGLAPPLQLSFDNPALNKARAVLGEEWGKKAVAVGAGGSIPIVADFKSVLGMDSLLVGFALDDDRVHSPNEKFDLTCYHKGIRSWARILSGAGGSITASARHCCLAGSHLLGRGSNNAHYRRHGSSSASSTQRHRTDVWRHAAAHRGGAVGLDRGARVAGRAQRLGQIDSVENRGQADRAGSRLGFRAAGGPGALSAAGAGFFGLRVHAGLCRGGLAAERRPLHRPSSA